MIDLHDPGTATPQQSLAFFRENQHRLGEIVDARLRSPGIREFPMILRDLAGNTIALSGCAAGGLNDASRAARTVLREAGFPPLQAASVVRRWVWLTKPLPPEVAIPAGLPWAPAPKAPRRQGRGQGRGPARRALGRHISSRQADKGAHRDR